jgi:hypothetical protein
MTTIEYATTLINPNYKHILEFGVFEGRTIRRAREISNSLFGGIHKVYGFDSFIGLPEDWVGEIGFVTNKESFDVKGNIPNIPGVKLFVGWFEDTIPDYLKEADDIALLHIDCDLYSSTVTVLESMRPYIKPGTIIVFDEWIYFNNPTCNDHEQKAFFEWVAKYNISYEFVDYDGDYENPVERKIVRIL